MPPSAEVLAVIPARGGSKGLPNKNIREVAGKPLLAWSIEAALSSTRVTRVVVSSDSEEIRTVAIRHGAEAIERPAELATDSAPSEPVLTHVLETLAKAATRPDIVILLQPTSPLRTADDIDRALALLDGSSADAVISVSEPPHSPYKCFRQTEDGYLAGLFSDEAPFERRQDLPRALMPNGAIYAIRTAAFARSGRLLTSRTLPYEMPEARSLDVDNGRDLETAATALGRAHAHALRG